MPAVETSDYVPFARRVIRAAGRRVADGDLGELGALARLRDDVDEALAAAVAGLRAEPHCYSWAAIAAELGITRQSARERWPEATGPRRPGGQPAHLR